MIIFTELISLGGYGIGIAGGFCQTIIENKLNLMP
jgi:hypothetical protein